MTAPLSRRRALAGAATLGVSTPLLSACGDDTDASATDPATSDAVPTSSAPPSSPTATATDDDAAPTGLVATGEVPVGGGVILKSEELVVTQPTAGEFKAFTAICTHQGCLVGSVSDGSIVCPCHDSAFSAADGSVEGGPASAPLEEIAVTVSGDQIVRA